MSKKKEPMNTDNYQLNDFISGSLSARNPQTKYSIYDSAEEEDINSKIFLINSYASFYPF